MRSLRVGRSHKQSPLSQECGSTVKSRFLANAATRKGGIPMFRKCADFLVLAVVGAILAIVLVGYTHGQGRRDRKIAVRKPAPFVHTVIFHLKKDAPENATDAVIADT